MVADVDGLSNVVAGPVLELIYQVTSSVENPDFDSAVEESAENPAFIETITDGTYGSVSVKTGWTNVSSGANIGV